MNKQFSHKALPVLTGFALLYGAEKAYKEPEFFGPDPAVRQVQASKERQIVKCGSSADDYEGIEVVTFVIGMLMVGAVMSLGR